ncbi:NAD(P)H-hydrate dehydratase [uncultured Mitsuokella sp.]|uniref:NAD(P)H-hydrate dehydratase n=1 Tax=uncultured Mitsuokella sp. TaxID=453120 RepID=UPI0026DD7B94|nr:NAD(P)H-hydrate dehydratase [uncultured Mitsuokella sp.]
MKLSLVQEMREIDRRAGEEYGLPELLLMETAGGKVAEAAIAMLGTVKGRQISIAAGSGNNGGDAFAAARYLANRGAAVKVFLAGNPEHIKHSPAVMRDVLTQMGIAVHTLTEKRDMDRLRLSLHFTDLIIDGLLGTGFAGAPREKMREVISMLNASGKPILAIDIASGVEADTGKVASVAIEAARTVTLGLPKPGHYLSPGADHTGKLSVSDIGIPYPLLTDDAMRQELLDERLAASLLPARIRAAHKGTCGRILVVAGSRGMTGAAAMASQAALRAGCGIVTLAVPASLQPLLAVKLTEVMTKPLLETDGVLGGEGALDELLALAGDYDGVLMGPGLGRAPQTMELVRAFAMAYDKPLVLDADALYAFRNHGAELAKCPQPPVITPHLGELVGLTGLTVPDLREDLLGFVREAAQEYRAILVAKSECTLVAYPDGRVYFTTVGNPGMATAGAGDVLAGTIAGLIEQTGSNQAPLVGTFLHGRAGDLAYARLCEGLVATDILQALPEARRQLENLPPDGRM